MSRVTRKNLRNVFLCLEGSRPLGRAELPGPRLLALHLGFSLPRVPPPQQEGESSSFASIAPPTQTNPGTH